METVSVLPVSSNWRETKKAATTAAQVNRLSHSIMNQLTVVYLSCASLRRSLDAKPCVNQDIETIEIAVAKVAAQVEALRFRLEKTRRARPRASSKAAHDRARPGSKLSVISVRDIVKR